MTSPAPRGILSVDMAHEFDKALYERLKNERAANYLRDIAMAELRACFGPNTSIYEVVAYLAHLFEERPEIRKEAESITVRQLLGSPIGPVSAHAPPIAANTTTVDKSLPESENVVDGFSNLTSTTRTRLATRIVLKMRACIMDVLESDLTPRSADEIIDRAIDLYEQGDYDFRISKHKWMMHFASWRHKEPELFNKSYRGGSNSEKDSLWNLRKFVPRR